MVQIKRGDDKFYIGDKESQPQGVMSFLIQDNGTVVIDHTEVDGNLKGQGVAKELVAAGVKEAREKNLKIIPECPYAKKVLEENPDYKDLIVAE
ncbi:GNAT family N-acetyltransferase [Macrococcus equipercicus]|uniref:N-acetyltransferase n=1 Tax=Macrococcus equipercicus TaxID=69967 RepID=A0A9Q9F1D4_9STAP|nr:GNAT family N-acetyltransferase [Macrococcus equipercicus]UTH13918.1 N-acetyltransferase [Macrococcus equipercicus]